MVKLKNNYVFEIKENEMNFIGDFNSLYSEEEDPWSQSANSGNDMDLYYEFSRNQILEILKEEGETGDNLKVLEIGCGLGYFTKKLTDYFPKLKVDGCDISEKAIIKAKKIHEDINFFELDILNIKSLNIKKYDVIIVNQVLWYLIHDLSTFINNVKSILNVNGILIISNAFPREQKYGGKIIKGFNGAFKYFNEIKGFNLVCVKYFNEKKLPHIDCIFKIIKND